MFTGRRCHLIHLTNDDAAHGFMTKLAESGEALVLTRARTGEDALQLLRSAKVSEKPNLVMMSWTLTGMSAEDFLLELKSDAVIKAVPVVVFTPRLPPNSFERIYSLGASCIIEITNEPEVSNNNLQLLFSFWTNVARLPFCEPPRQD